MIEQYHADLGEVIAWPAVNPAAASPPPPPPPAPAEWVVLSETHALVFGWESASSGAAPPPPPPPPPADWWVLSETSALVFPWQSTPASAPPPAPSPAPAPPPPTAGSSGGGNRRVKAMRERERAEQLDRANQIIQIIMAMVVSGSLDE